MCISAFAPEATPTSTTAVWGNQCWDNYTETTMTMWDTSLPWQVGHKKKVGRTAIICTVRPQWVGSLDRVREVAGPSPILTVYG